MDPIMCDECDIPMDKEGVRPLRVGFDVDIFRCPGCGRRHEVKRDTRFPRNEE